MEARLQKWGNSDGIRIPSSILKSLKLKTNDKVDLNYEDDKIIITKPKKSKISLEERFEKYNGENLAKDFIWDDAKGREIW
ncbi:MAG: AbrB/MazE/SpoVT family DNA-binding domain-containing protein [Bacilli bacterium]|nr:AbrB/MazE/SpoVT family DNA-binding domain-containing protein [Bacilli bacterium]